MTPIGVDTAGLAAGGGQISALGSSLGQARASIGRVQGASGASGVADVDGAIDDLVQSWGVAVVALQEAAVGLGRGATLAATAYDATDRGTIGP